MTAKQYTGPPKAVHTVDSPRGRSNSSRKAMMKAISRLSPTKEPMSFSRQLST